MRNLLILIAFISLSASAQKYQPALLYGKEEWRFQVIKDLGIPSDTLLPPLTDSARYKPHIASISGIFYLYKPTTQHWVPIGTSAINTAPPIYNFGDTITLSAVPTDLGGTGQTSVGLPYQLLRTNSAATGTEWWSFRKYDYNIDSTIYESPLELIYLNDTTNRLTVHYETPTWNANKIQGYDMEDGEPDDGATWIYSLASHRWMHSVPTIAMNKTPHIDIAGFDVGPKDLIYLFLLGIAFMNKRKPDEATI
jgi:hypothetical protein